MRWVTWNMTDTVPDHVRGLISKAADQFMVGHTPEDVRPTFADGDMAYIIFWREVEAEVKRRSKRVAVIPEWYKMGWT